MVREWKAEPLTERRWLVIMLQFLRGKLTSKYLRDLESSHSWGIAILFGDVEFLDGDCAFNATRRLGAFLELYRWPEQNP
jgi:hypothetical protein